MKRATTTVMGRRLFTGSSREGTFKNSPGLGTNALRGSSVPWVILIAPCTPSYGSIRPTLCLGVPSVFATLPILLWAISYGRGW